MRKLGLFLLALLIILVGVIVATILKEATGFPAAYSIALIVIPGIWWLNRK